MSDKYLPPFFWGGHVPTALPISYAYEHFAVADDDDSVSLSSVL